MFVWSQTVYLQAYLYKIRAVLVQGTRHRRGEGFGGILVYRTVVQNTRHDVLVRGIANHACSLLGRAGGARTHGKVEVKGGHVKHLQRTQCGHGIESFLDIPSVDT